MIKPIFIIVASGFIGSSLGMKLWQFVKSATYLGLDGMIEYYNVPLEE